MIVYHGSTEIIKVPDVEHSKKYLNISKIWKMILLKHLLI